MPSITNGKLSTNDNTVRKAGETVHVNFTCNNNLSPVNHITTCQSDRTWNPNPSCSNITCVVPTLNYGYYMSNNITMSVNTSVAHQSVITPYCFDGYALNISAYNYLTCQNDSQWSGQAHSCTPITCNNTPEVFVNGIYDIGGNTSTFQYNHYILPKCNIGFYLQNGTERRCNGINSWSGESPVCSEITCISPNVFTNGRYNGSQTNYSYGTVLVPLCDKGHYIANNVTERACEENDIWKWEDPVCQIVQCTEPQPVEHGSLNSSHEHQYEYKTIITLTCDIGYEPANGITNASCLDTGSWDSMLQCVKLQCNNTSDVEHAAIQTYPLLAFGDVEEATYNATFFNLMTGSLKINCSLERRLSWIDPPQFGKSSYV